MDFSLPWRRCRQANSPPPCSPSGPSKASSSDGLMIALTSSSLLTQRGQSEVSIHPCHWSSPPLPLPEGRKLVGSGSDASEAKRKVIFWLWCPGGLSGRRSRPVGLILDCGCLAKLVVKKNKPKVKRLYWLLYIWWVWWGVGGASPERPLAAKSRRIFHHRVS